MIALIGPVTIDEVRLPGRDVDVRPGGAPLYARRALRAVGVEPVVIVKGEGMDADLVLPSTVPVRSVLMHHADGLEQRLDAVGEPFTAEEVRGPMAALLARCRWALLGAQSAGDFPPETIRALVDSGLRLCLDAQGLARGADAGPVVLRPFPASAVAGVTALKLNRAEAEAVGDLEPLLAAVDELLITDGPEGATVITGQGSVRARGSSHPFADPTGAGDSFTAVYVLERERGRDPGAAATRAVAVVEALYGDDAAVYSTGDPT
ncbi:MAG: PfkB family carbohydrate kinase [Gaiellales bacterium]